MATEKQTVNEKNDNGIRLFIIVIDKNQNDSLRQKIETNDRKVFKKQVIDISVLIQKCRNFYNNVETWIEIAQRHET